jgi:uncharacterized protein (DUF983 family)
MGTTPAPAPAPAPVATLLWRGLTGHCPRCGEGSLFAGFLSLRPSCNHCGLDYSFIDSGDGPAVFVIFIAGFLVAGAALVTEVLYAPSLWVHAALWAPLTVILCVLPLRPLKGIVIALQYHFQAAEHRVDRMDG